MRIAMASDHAGFDYKGRIARHLRESGHEVGDFLTSVRTRAKPGADVEIGHRTVTVCHLGGIAYRLGRPLKWDPVKEEFLGDDEANRLCARAMREPWSS